MIVITAKTDHHILMVGSALDYLDNGYPRLINEKTIFPSHMVEVSEVDTIPEEVAAGSYCYTKEEGFYPLPGTRQELTAEQIAEVEQDYRDKLVREVSGNDA